MTPSRQSAAKRSSASCDADIPVTCSEAFREIATQIGRLGKGQEALGAKLDAVSKAVLGNGITRDSLLARVERIESSAETVRYRADRFWKVFGVLTAVAAVLVAIFR
ncbi:MAG: hypothetical protein J7M21_06240 [Planctomycetes bacterium]|nr:hypothetical protein [Planctomycetota bacterium]